MGETPNWIPQIAPPSQLYSLDPNFASCLINMEQGFDPPTALTAQASLLTSATATDPAITSSNPEPASTPNGGPGPTRQTSVFIPIPQSNMVPASSGSPVNDPHATLSPGSPDRIPSSGNNDPPGDGNLGGDSSSRATPSGDSSSGGSSSGVSSNGDSADDESSESGLSNGGSPSDGSEPDQSSPDSSLDGTSQGSTDPQGNSDPSSPTTPTSLTIPIDPSTATVTLPAQLSQTVVAAPGALVLAGQTLQPGGSAITVSGLVYSLAPADPTGHVGASASAILRITNAPGQAPPLPVASGVDPLATVAGEVFSPLSSGYGFVVDGTSTLLTGQAVTVGGTAVSLVGDGHGLVIGTSTMVLEQETGRVRIGSGSSSGSGSGNGLGGYTWSGIGGSGDAAATATDSVNGGSGQETIAVGGARKVDVMVWYWWSVAIAIGLG